jgi:ABC-type arginine transport system permease subunit
LMFNGELMAATTFRHTTIFTVIAVLYLAVCWPSAAIIDRLERKLKEMPRDQDPADGRRRWPLSLFPARKGST